MPKKKVSRQRLWQRRMREAGRCVACGKAAVTVLHCMEHARAASERVLRAYHRDHPKARKRTCQCSACGASGHYATTCQRRAAVAKRAEAASGAREGRAKP